MSESKQYQGSCHCGKVRYEVTADLSQVMQCNCSICSRAGYLMSFAPAEQFKLLSGENEVTDYLFNKHKIHHMFCKTCGVRSFGRGAGSDGKTMYMINARCLEGVDPTKLSIKYVDGKSL
jgi:hypothetical protein